jgi:hypothetical protein
MADVKIWHEDDPHGQTCAMRVIPAAECTCGKLDALLAQKEADDEAQDHRSSIKRRNG